MENTEATPSPVPGPNTTVHETTDYVSLALKDALIAKGLAKPTAEAVPVNPIPVNPGQPPPPPPVSDMPIPVEEKKPPVSADSENPFNKGFEKLAAEAAAFRKEKEEFKNELDALRRARVAKDPISALSALGFNASDLAQHFSANPPQQIQPEPELPPSLQQRLARLEQFEFQQQQNQIFSQLKSNIAPEKYPYISNLGEHQAVMKAINDFHQSTGRLPGSNFQETVNMAAEYVESQLKAQAQKFLKVNGVLTNIPPPVNNNPVASSEQQSGQGSPGKTLTNRTSAPASAAARTTSIDRDSLINDLLSDPNFHIT